MEIAEKSQQPLTVGIRKYGLLKVDARTMVQSRLGPESAVGMRMRSLAAVLVLVLVSGVATANPGIGDRAPAVDLPALDGGLVRLGQAGERVVVVDYFATWCQPCRAAMAALDEIVRPLAGRARLVIVDVGEPPEVVRRFFAEHPAPAGAEIALDRDSRAAHLFGQDRFPTTFLLDRGAVIRHINRGFGSGYARRVGDWLRALLETPR